MWVAYATSGEYKNIATKTKVVMLASIKKVFDFMVFMLLEIAVIPLNKLSARTGRTVVRL